MDKVFQGNNRFLTWITDHILASVIMFDIALFVPLLVLLPVFSSFQGIIIILSSNWIQLWALFALQRSAKKADLDRNAKAEADHQALTHIANIVEKIAEQCGESKTRP